MNMNLKGKIGRLPEAIREGVNVRSELAGSEPDWQEAIAPGDERVRMDENLAKLKRIKVNQGDTLKKEEVQTELVGCSPSPLSSPPGRGGDLTRVGVQESVTTSAAVGGMRMGANMAELGPIKVDQGEILKNKGTETEPAGFPRSWKNSQPQSACYAGKVCPAPSGTDSTSFGLHSASIHLEGQRGKSELIGLNWGEIFYPGREGRGRGGSAGAKDSLIKHDMQGSNPAGHEINFLRTCVQVGAN